MVHSFTAFTVENPPHCWGYYIQSIGRPVVFSGEFFLYGSCMTPLYARLDVSPNYTSQHEDLWCHEPATGEEALICCLCIKHLWRISGGKQISGSTGIVGIVVICFFCSPMAVVLGGVINLHCKALGPRHYMAWWGSRHIYLFRDIRGIHWEKAVCLMKGPFRTPKRVAQSF